jgi:hypothetical protein
MAFMTNWISQLARRLADIFEPSWPVDERDADARRVRSELAAIRLHFPDHA